MYIFKNYNIGNFFNQFLLIKIYEVKFYEIKIKFCQVYNYQNVKRITFLKFLYIKKKQMLLGL